MERYIEMGFQSDEAREAMERFGDDLHAGCHWLMVRQTMGNVPKRLKASHQENTYLGSTIRLNSTTWTVDDCDSKHALIRIRRGENLPCRWEHMSDSRIEWLSITHERPSIVVPRVAWKRSLGVIQVCGVFLREVKIKITPNNLLGIFIRWGRPSSDSGEWEKWRVITSLTREHIHRPSRPRPRGGFSSDVHDFRVEWMTYFHGLCDVHNIGIDTFSNALYNTTVSETAALFPESIRDDLTKKLTMWKSPSDHIKTELQNWRKDCLPVILFEPREYNNDIIKFEVFIHDMTFVKPQHYDSSTGLHLQMQRLFMLLFPKERPATPIPGPIDLQFFNNVLRASKKQIKSPLVAPGDSFKSQLFPFQEKCLTWLVERERTAPSTSSWGWTQRKLTDGFTFHSSAFGHLTLSQPNTTVRGGLLAQDVGMGKTVQMLALIATNKANGPTLVVVPTTMLSVWMDEANKHVPSLSVVKFHGARRTRNMDELRQSDVVLTTYRIVVNETQQHVPTIGAIRWGRIVLDESHEMRSVTSATTKAVCRLYAPYRWCISATPWPKGFVNAASMLAFWGVTPFDDVNSNVAVRNTSCITPSLLCDILSSTTWWQQKRHVRLNLPAVTNRSIELPHSSSVLYDQLRSSIVHRMEVDQSTPGINHLTRRLHYMRWLRQAAIHPLLNRFSHYGFPATEQTMHTETNSIQSFIDTLGTTNYDQSLRDLIQSWADGNERCAICMDAMDRPTVTPCHHMFCFECIQSSYQHDSMRKCPLCRTPAGNSILHELSVEEPEQSNVPSTWYTSDANGQRVEMDKCTHESLVALNGTHGHKINRFIRLVKESTEKFVIFTRFHGAWKMVCDALQLAAISFVSIEGRMTPKRRATSIEQFQNNTDVRVFVMTTKTASVGITLTAGSHVVFLEPCNDTHIRKQAVGRVWRIGQQNPITVTTFKTLGTVDCVSDLDSHLNISNQTGTSV
tara:strand:- start:8853 stop:11738 length:2886 start_codon:yes stop_codon:yes gene_type:complete